MHNGACRSTRGRRTSVHEIQSPDCCMNCAQWSVSQGLLSIAVTGRSITSQVYPPGIQSFNHSHACAGSFLPMFQACTLMMRKDAQTAMFLMPYIVQVQSHAYSNLQAKHVSMCAHPTSASWLAFNQHVRCDAGRAQQQYAQGAGVLSSLCIRIAVQYMLPTCPWSSVHVNSYLVSHADHLSGHTCCAPFCDPLHSSTHVQIRSDSIRLTERGSRAMQDAVCQGGEAARQQILAEIAAVLELGYTSAEGCLCVQAVFALTDVLRDWLEQRRPATPGPASGSMLLDDGGRHADALHGCAGAAPSHGPMTATAAAAAAAGP